MVGEDIQPLVEERVTSHAIAVETRDGRSDFEGRVAVDARGLTPCGLARYVIWHLVLEEDVGAAVAVPDHVELLEVLDEQPIGGDVVAIDDYARVSRVHGLPNAGAVVGPPGPDVVEDDVVAVNNQRGFDLARLGASDPEENVVEAWRVGVVDLRIGLV